MEYKKVTILAVLSVLLLAAVSVLIVPFRNDIYNKEDNHEGDREENVDIIDQAYFGDKLEFDARRFLDLQDKNFHFYWDFGDGSGAEGVKVEHIYDFRNEYDLEYPVYYTITLMAFDGAKSISTTHLIRLYPKSYTFYLDKYKLKTEVPSSNKETIKVASRFDLESIKGLTYKFENIVKINRCKLLVTLYLEKPLFSTINKISLILFDKYGKEVSKIDKEIDEGFFWRSKKIEINGALDKEAELKSVEILFHGFSIGERIRIIYGYGRPSSICFIFS